METFIERILEFKVKSIGVRIDTVSKPSGKHTRRLIIDYPDAIALIPFIPPDHVLLVRQFRYALNQETLEFPAGKIDPGESAEDAVHRELLEETGYRAGKIQKIQTYAPAMGYSSERIHLFFVTDLIKTEYAIDLDEISTVEKISLEKVWKGVLEDTFIDPKIPIGMLLADKLGLLRVS